MPSTASVTPTGDPYVDGVLSGVKWGVTSLTFSFPTDPSYYGSSYGAGSEPTNGFKAFTTIQQDAVRAALQMYSAVANVTFTEVTESATTHGDLRYAESNNPSTAWAYYPSTSEKGGDVWANNSTHWYDNPVKGNYAFLTMIHETGHAMGLKHPHDASGSFGAMPARSRLARIFRDELPLLCRSRPRRLYQRVDQLSDDADDVRHRGAANGVRRQLHHQQRRHDLYVGSVDRTGVRQRRRPGRPVAATRSS